MDYDVAIIGGGVIGSVAAFHLAHKGASVVWIEDGQPGSTTAAAGMLSPSFEHTHDAGKPALEAMLSEALGCWEEFAYQLSDDPYRDFGYHRRGVYGIGYHARPADAEQPSPDALPAFHRKPSMFLPQEGAVEPKRLLSFIRERVAVMGVQRIVGRAKLSADQLSVNGQVIEARNWVQTTGAAMPGAVQGLMGVKGEAFIARLADEDRGAVPTVVRSPTTYFVPRDDGTLYIGATEEWPGAIAATADELWRDAERLLPCLGRAERLARLEGLRPFVSRDGPIIARSVENRRLILALGHHRNGVLLAPFTGEAIDNLLA